VSEQRAAPAERDPEAARAAIRERATEIRDEQVATALAQLDDDPETRAAVETLADRLVETLVSPPERALADADPSDPTVETAMALFGRASEEE